MENLPEVKQETIITKADIDNFLFASNTRLTDNQKAMFFQVAHINNLNPFRREIYAIPYGDKFNIITGYEVYVKRAERSGKLDGWEADYKNDPQGDYAYCTIYRKDWSKPFTQKVWLSEFKQNNKMWSEKPKTMLIKVAIATAFRRAFPEEIGGLPYTSDEMPMEAEIVKQTPIQQPVEQPEVEPEPETFKSAMDKFIAKLPTSKQEPARQKLELYIFNKLKDSGQSQEEFEAGITDYRKFWDEFIFWVKTNR